MRRSNLTRRHVLKTAALGSAALITAPYVSGVHAAGSATPFEDHELPTVLAKYRDESAQEMLRHIMIALHRHQHDELEDDAAAICLDFHP